MKQLATRLLAALNRHNKQDHTHAGTRHPQRRNCRPLLQQLEDRTVVSNPLGGLPLTTLGVSLCDPVIQFITANDPQACAVLFSSSADQGSGVTSGTSRGSAWGDLDDAAYSTSWDQLHAASRRTNVADDHPLRLVANGNPAASSPTLRTGDSPFAADPLDRNGTFADELFAKAILNSPTARAASGHGSFADLDDSSVRDAASAPGNFSSGSVRAQVPGVPGGAGSELAIELLSRGETIRAIQDNDSLIASTLISNSNPSPLGPAALLASKGQTASSMTPHLGGGRGTFTVTFGSEDNSGSGAPSPCSSQLPPGWTVDEGGVAEMRASGVGYGGSTILPRVGSSMLWLSSSGSTVTASCTNSLGESGTTGTIVRGPTAFLAAGTTVSAECYFTSNDHEPYHDFALGVVGDQQLTFTLTGNPDPDVNYDSGWQSVSTTVSVSGTYQLVIAVSNQGDSLVPSELYIDNVGGFPFPELPCVSIDASDPYAAEAGANPGGFTVTRTGDLSNNLTVYGSSEKICNTASEEYATQ